MLIFASMPWIVFLACEIQYLPPEEFEVATPSPVTDSPAEESHDLVDSLLENSVSQGYSSIFFGLKRGLYILPVMEIKWKWNKKRKPKKQWHKLTAYFFALINHWFVLNWQKKWKIIEQFQY